MLTGVSVLPVKDNQLGLIQVFRHPMGRWSWEAPKGFIDLDESPEQAAMRELYEETGFELSAENLYSLGQTTPEAGLINGRIGLYAAVLDVKCVPDSVTHELGHGKLEFFDRGQIAKLITLGQIEDACTLSALFLYFIQQQNWLVSGKLNETRENI
ncbi:MAG: NUDIX hydrolase [Methylobacter sp.]|nr:NUDIX hydrolase [Methylobacter sp.]